MSKQLKSSSGTNFVNVCIVIINVYCKGKTNGVETEISILSNAYIKYFKFNFPYLICEAM